MPPLTATPWVVPAVPEWRSVHLSSANSCCRRVSASKQGMQGTVLLRMLRLEVHLHGLPQREKEKGAHKKATRSCGLWALGGGRVWGRLHADVALVLRVPHRPSLPILPQKQLKTARCSVVPRGEAALSPAEPPPRLQVASFSSRSDPCGPAPCRSLRPMRPSTVQLRRPSE